MEQEFGEQFAGGWFRGWGGGQRMGRGGLSHIVLYTLLEKPMHGYEIIRTLEEQSHGMWRPSAGSIYPTLQLLEEQELVTSTEAEGKNIYALTDSGRKTAEASHSAFKSPHWKEHMRRGKRFGILKETIRGLIHTMRDIGTSASEEQIAEAKIILDRALKDLQVVAEATKKNPSH